LLLLSSGKVRPVRGILIPGRVVMLEFVWSRLWLAHFRFGPMEWLWRSLTYGKGAADAQGAERGGRGGGALAGVEGAVSEEEDACRRRCRRRLCHPQQSTNSAARDSMPLRRRMGRLRR
jgi:hypothetical protein